jgi:hypothetical protein
LSLHIGVSRRDREVVFQVARFRSGIAVTVLAGGLVAAGAAPAVAAPAASPTVTIAAKSVFKPVTGDVFVVFLAGKFASAHIHGTITGGNGGVATLLAQTFPFKSPAVQAGSKKLSGATVPYTFTVTPALATRYEVKVVTSSSVTSAPVTVYVSNQQTVSPTKRCSRPVCHERIRVTEIVPASTLSDEISKHWYFYFALNRNPNRTPPTPRFATLDTHVSITRPVAGRSRMFTRTLSWSFRIGKDGYGFVWATCSKDTEATDGLGLPGHHACGVRVIDATAEYIG